MMGRFISTILDGVQSLPDPQAFQSQFSIFLHQLPSNDSYTLFSRSIHEIECTIVHWRRSINKLEESENTLTRFANYAKLICATRKEIRRFLIEKYEARHVEHCADVRRKAKQRSSIRQVEGDTLKVLEGLTDVESAPVRLAEAATQQKRRRTCMQEELVLLEGILEQLREASDQNGANLQQRLGEKKMRRHAARVRRSRRLSEVMQTHVHESEAAHQQHQRQHIQNLNNLDARIGGLGHALAEAAMKIIR